MPTPSRAASSSNPRTVSVAPTSRPLVGEQATSTRGWLESSRASRTFWMLPPDSWRAGVWGEDAAILKRRISSTALARMRRGCRNPWVELQRDLPLRLRRALPLLANHHITADHHSRQLTGVRIPGHHGADHLPPSQYGDPVRDRHHLFELVRDEDDGALLRRHQSKRLEEVIRLLGRELRGRLVEDQDAGAAIQDLEDLDALLLTD